MADAPVSLGVVFERFPASVRGAVVVRGLDPDPHQVSITDVSAVEAGDPSRLRTAILTEPAVVDVVPRGEVVVPFDAPFSILAPGWYRIEVEAVVDGQRRVHGPSEERTFSVPWPAEDLRRGQIRVGRSVGSVEIDRVECKADRSIVRWRGQGDADVRVLAGRQRIPVLERPEGPGPERATVAYPILRRYTSLTFETELGGERSSTTLELG